MLDFIKVCMPSDYIGTAKDLPFLEFKSEVNLATGELLPLEVAKYHCMTIRVNPYQVEISGSLHKFWNSIHDEGEQNHNDFTFIESRVAIFLIADIFNFDLEDANILNVEFGVNIKLPLLVDDLLKTKLLSCKYQRPSQINHYDGKGNYVEFVKREYYLKIYDKGSHYGLDEQILRFEIKTRKSKFISRLGIDNLFDLLEPMNYYKLKRQLIKKANEVVILDYLDFSKIKDSSERSFLQIHSNPSIWATYECSRKKRRSFDAFIDLCEKYDYMELKTLFLEILAQKCETLLDSAKLLQSPFMYMDNCNNLKNSKINKK